MHSDCRRGDDRFGDSESVFERRSYVVSTEAFLGQPERQIMRVLQGRSR